MSSSSKDVYKFFINSLINSKINGDVNFEKNLDSFVKKLEDDLAYSQEVIGKSILGIEADIRSANKKILFLDKKTVEEANQCYAGINRKSLQRRLISAHESMGLFIKNQDIKAACKYLIVQVELLCNHLSVEAEIVNWVLKNKPINVNLSYPNHANAALNIPYLSTWNLLKAIDRRFSLQFDETAFYEIKQMRDYESHGYHENQIAAMELLLTKVTANWGNYYNEGLRFIEKLIIEHYNY
jgi:hypothetical protein